MKIKDYIIEIKCNIREALQQIDKNSKGIVCVCENGKLIGTVTDGDVRRYLLKGGSLEEEIGNIANRKPIYAETEQNIDYREYMKKNGITALPIVNKKKKVIRIEFLHASSDLKKGNLKIPVVIMAGGKGTRLKPYTDILPKPLIPIGDKTITEHIMGNFVSYGCEEFHIIVNYKKNFIKSYFADKQINSHIEFIDEEQFLGTAGGLKLLSGKVTDTFFMTNCDILVEADYEDIMTYHKQHQSIITLVCAQKTVTIPYGTIEINEEGNAVELKEKPKFNFLTNTGFYVLEAEFLDMIPENQFIDITDIIQKCIEEHKKVGVYLIPEERWMDMGQIEELEKMKEKMNIYE